MALSSYQPLRNRVLCRALRDDETAGTVGTIILLDSTRDRQKQAQWIVVAIGPDVMDEHIVPDARVLLEQHSGTPVDLDGEPCMFVYESKVKAIFQEE